MLVPDAPFVPAGPGGPAARILTYLAAASDRVSALIMQVEDSPGSILVLAEIQTAICAAEELVKSGGETAGRA